MSKPSASGTRPDTLAARDVDVAFRGVVALQGATMTLARKEILGLIGPNGAGKTTLINVLSGFVAPDRGDVLLGGRTITRLAVHRRSELGLARTFQSVRLFGRLTVAENLEAAALATGLGGRRARAAVDVVLERMDLLEHRDDPAAQLSHGTERRVGIARALATAPAFLLLDEPAAGLDDVETGELGVLLRRIHDDLEVGMLVVEHDMSLVMTLCERLHVLVDGRTLAVGTPREMRDDPAVQDAYLGLEEERLVASS